MKHRCVMSALLCIASGALPLAADAAPSAPCAASETTYFSCPVTRGRSVALCGAADQSVRYRFGRPGAIELQYPQEASGSAGQMFYAHYSRYQTDRFEVRFNNQGTEYVVFDYHEDGRHRAGVRVTGADAKEREVICTGRIASRIGELKDRLPCDADSALNGGACR
jgi:hypothetical protein